jgi:RNA polymerase sigma-70 factor (ECF subfamily)
VLQCRVVRDQGQFLGKALGLVGVGFVICAIFNGNWFTEVTSPGCKQNEFTSSIAVIIAVTITYHSIIKYYVPRISVVRFLIFQFRGEFMRDFTDKFDLLVVEVSLTKGSSRLQSDHILILRIQAGDRDALAILYERHLPSVWRYVYSRLGGRESASCDVVSETFMAMVQSIERLDATGTDLAKWLSGVARNKLADHWRRTARETTSRDLEPPEQETGHAADIDALDIRHTVGLAMDRIEDMHRIVLELKYLDKLTVREISQRLGRSEKAVEGILSRARAAFKTLYTENQTVNSRRPL